MTDYRLYHSLLVNLRGGTFVYFKSGFAFIYFSYYYRRDRAFYLIAVLAQSKLLRDNAQLTTILSHMPTDGSYNS